MSNDGKPDANELTAEKLTKLYKGRIAQKVLEGNVGLAGELERLERIEASKRRPRPEPLEVRKPKRPYHMSPEAIQARQDNAQHSTGPVTAAGKAKSSRNARKHGRAAASLINRIIKPCFSTCEYFKECEFVLDGKTTPGDDCLDKANFLDALSAIEAALKNPDDPGYKEMVSVELAAVFDVIRQIREDIAEKGVLLKSQKTDELGGVVFEEWKLHPGLMALPKLLADFGISLKDWNLTPAQVAKVKTDEKTAETAASLMAGIMGRGKG